MQREKNWQTTFRRSLGDSVGNALWMAVITPEEKNSKSSGTPKSISIPCIVEAERLFKAGDFEKADELLAKEIVENPTNYLAGYHRILNRCRYFYQTNHPSQNITVEGTNASSHLYTKSYHVKPLVFEKALRGVLSGEDIRNDAGDLVTANIVEEWCLLLKTLGIEVVSPKPGDESEKSKTWEQQDQPSSPLRWGRDWDRHLAYKWDQPASENNVHNCGSGRLPHLLHFHGSKPFQSIEQT